MKKYFLRYYQRFISLQGIPRMLALAFAVGVAISFLPLIGTHTVLAILISSLFRMNLSGMLLGTWVGSNPLTIAPAFAGEFYLGKWLLGYSDLAIPIWDWNLAAIWDLGWEIISSMIVGGMVIGVGIAILSYPVVRWLFRRIQFKQEAQA